MLMNITSGVNMKTNRGLLAVSLVAGLLASTGLVAGTTPAYNKTSSSLRGDTTFPALHAW
jgi:hypothetical protein